MVQNEKLRNWSLQRSASRSSLLRHRWDYIFVTSQLQLTSCLVSTNLSLMSRTLSAPRQQFHSASCLIWCKLLIKNLKPSFPNQLSLKWRSSICFKTCSLGHDLTNYNLDCSEWNKEKWLRIFWERMSFVFVSVSQLDKEQIAGLHCEDVISKSCLSHCA